MSDSTESHDAQQLNLFSVKKMAKISEGTKALVFLLWRKPEKPLSTFSKQTIDSELANLDVLEFDWTLLPQHVFVEVFQKFSYEQVCYICGTEGIQFDPKLMRSSGLTGGKAKNQLIEKLWNHMNSSK